MNIFNNIFLCKWKSQKMICDKFLDFSYKHAIDGVYRIVKEEGPIKSFSGATMASSRAVLVTIGQVRLV